MTRIAFPLIVALTAVNVGAVELPWQKASPGEPPQYCKGFVVGGLDSNLVSGRSRTDLWLAWSYIIRSGALEQSASEDDYQAGRETFRNVPDTAAAEAILQNADGDCGLGRTGRQITGW